MLSLALNPLARERTRDGFPFLHGAFPMLGHLPAMATDYLGLLREGERRQGPFFWVDLSFGKAHLMCLVPDAFSLLKNKLTTSVGVQPVDGPLFGDALITHDGKKHQHMRSALNPTFGSKGLTALEVGTLFAERIARRVHAWPESGPVRVLHETRELALSLIFGMMGVEEAELAVWRKHYEDLILLLLPIPFTWPGTPQWRGRRARVWLDARLQRILDDVRAKPDARGLLAELARSRDEAGEPLSDQEILDNLRLLVLAGHETTASVLAWIVAELAQRPVVWDTLCEEACASEAPLGPKDLARFPFAEAVFRETLRLHPPVSVDERIATAAFELGGRTIPPGTHVAIPILCMARDPQVYERPEEFSPARWLRKTTPTPVELAQFGGGPHFCLGYHLALLEAVQFTVLLARRMREKRARPRLENGFPAPRYLPLMHPAASMQVRFA